MEGGVRFNLWRQLLGQQQKSDYGGLSFNSNFTLTLTHTRDYHSLWYFLSPKGGNLGLCYKNIFYTFSETKYSFIKQMVFICKNILWLAIIDHLSTLKRKPP